MTNETKTLGTIDILYFNFKDAGLFLGCVGTKSQIQHMRAYEYYQRERHGRLISDFINRALANDLFCYLEGETLSGKLLEFLLNTKIAKTGKKINEALWFEAVFLVSPRAINKRLGIPMEELIKLRNDSVWAGIFDFEEPI